MALGVFSDPTEAVSLHKHVQGQARRVGSELLGLLFPFRCTSCKRVDEVLCEDCRAAFAPVQAPVCVQCGQPADTQGTRCWRCQQHETSYVACRSIFGFEGTLRIAVHGLKYEGRVEIASLLAHEMIEGLVRDHPEHEEWPLEAVLAVPLHPAREAERGYNQARLLARPLADQWGLPLLDDALWRVRDTRPQLGLNAQDRRQNVSDAFQADEWLVNGLAVLLVDDVRTTGATLESCSAALISAGAQAVYALTLAQAI